MNGYVLVDKVAGVSSHGAVQQVRRRLDLGGRRGTRAGHAGTLDPFATGLLVVLLGRATRLMPFVVGHDKRYLVHVRFGASSSTDDREGELQPSQDPPPAEEAVRAAAAQLAEATEQVPPAVSAIHIDGVRAYRRVRRGEVVVVPPRPVRFHHLELVAWQPAGDADVGPCATLDVGCGTGTYMRALARDLGELVGCPAHCEQLRRLEVGAWHVDDARRWEELTRQDVRDPLELVPDLPRAQLDQPQLRDVAAGRRLPISLAPEATGPLALVGPDGGLVALAEATSDGTLLQPRTVLVDPASS